MDWSRFWRNVLATIIGLFMFIATAIYMVNPYGNLLFTPPFEKAVMATNQRFSYPSVARDPRFDSAVFGTSTSRLLDPKDLERRFGGDFANLAMNSSTAYEQYRLLDIYLRVHPLPRTVVVGLDISWCEAGDELHKYTFREFPEWMYDDTAWNDFPNMLTLKTLEIVGRKVGYLLGIRDTKYDADGYRNFLPSPSEYDLEKVRRGLYGAEGPRERSYSQEPQFLSVSEREDLNFPSHDLLKKTVEIIPDETKKVFFFAPYHFFSQPLPGTPSGEVWSECKRRINDIVSQGKNVWLVDLMIPSSLTQIDSNYWDPLHYTTNTATSVVNVLGDVVDESRQQPELYHLLYTSR